jgi:hypothetical protein
MPTAIQKRSGSFSALLLAGDLTFGQSETLGLISKEIERAYNHVVILNEGTFRVGAAYLPFAPKRTFQVRPWYRFGGRMSVLPFHLDD